MATRAQTKTVRRRHSNPTVAISMLAMAIVFAVLTLRRGGVPAPVVVQSMPVVGQFDTVSVPVPIEAVPAGTRIRDVSYKLVSFPKHQLPEGAITDLASLPNESYTVAPLPANLPLFRSNFRNSASATNPVVERIPAGMRAMTVRVDATAAVEGWAGSGSIVDVLLVESERTTVVAERVKVLSAERSVSPVEGGVAPSIPSTVTLLVTQEQCLAINTAIPHGKIAFALRSSGDDDSWRDTIYTADQLKGGAIVTDHNGAITGYAAVRQSGESKSFTLANGHWMRTDSVPQGFLVGEEQ